MARSTLPAWLLGFLLLASAIAVVAVLLLEDVPLPAGGSPVRGAEADAESGRRMQLPEAQGEAARPVDGLPEPPGELAREAAGERLVAGRVLRLADGSPIRGWTLLSVAARTTTGAEDGRFHLPGVGADERRLELVHLARVLAVPLPEGEGDLVDVELVVDTGWLVPGLVLSDAGAPVGGATITAEGDVPAVHADASGRFLLADVVTEDGGPVASLSASAPWHVSGEATVRLEGSQRRTAPVEFRLAASGALAGRVLAPDGDAAPGHEVRVRLQLGESDLDGAPESLRATSDARGEWRIDGVPAGRWMLVVSRDLTADEASAARDAGGADVDVGARDPQAPAPLWVPHVEVRAAATTELDLQLLAGAVVAGRVTDGAGNPVPGAQVSAARALRWPVPPPNGSSAGYFGELRVLVDDSGGGGQVTLTGDAGAASTGDDGSYVLGGLPGGEVCLTAAVASSPGWRPLERTLELAPGRRVDGIDFALGSGLSVSGRVFDEAGRPVAGAALALLAAEGAAVIAGDDRIASDAEGRFAFTGLSAGRSRLYVSHPGHRAQWLEVEAGAPELRIDLVPAPVLAGRVLDAFTGQPVTRYRIRLDTETMGMSNDWSAEDGRFVVDSLEQVPHTLRIEAAGYEPHELAGVVPGFDGAELEILLRPGG